MLIFNTQYRLRHDVERILLINKSQFGSASFMSFIHPVYAWLLNQFDGKTNDDIIFKRIQNELQVKDIYALLNPLIDNSTDVIMRYDGVISIFPPNVLTNNSGNMVRGKEKDSFFTSIHNINHNDWRLFRPLNLLICPTLKCYTNCIYCYANRQYAHKELNSEEWKECILQAKQCGIERIDVTGGEFLLKKDWKEIAKSLTLNGYFPDISTKIPLRNKDIEAILDCGLRKLQISLDTLSSIIASNTLNVDDNYILRIKETIRYADALGLKLIIKPTLTKFTCTIENIKSILSFANTLKNVDRVVVSVIGFSCYKPRTLYKNIRPSLTQIELVRNFLGKESKHFNFPIHDDTFIYTRNEMMNSIIFEGRAKCTANLEGFVVLPDGTVTICEELYWNKNFIIGNIARDSIMQIWNSSKALKLSKLGKEDYPYESNCRECDQLAECHSKRGVCWKLIQCAYGAEHIFYPDPRCPKAPLSQTTFTID